MVIICYNTLFFDILHFNNLILFYKFKVGIEIEISLRFVIYLIINYNISEINYKFKIVCLEHTNF